jgi:hypothetical protein
LDDSAAVEPATNPDFTPKMSSELDRK